MKLTRIFLTVLCAATSLQLTAQEISLEQARNLALEHNRDIHKSQLTLEQTGHDVKAYRTNFYPRISLIAADFYSTAKGYMTLTGGNLPIYVMNPATGTYVPNVTVNADGSYTLNQYAMFPDQTIDYKVKNVFLGGIQLQQPLYMGGKISTAYRMAKDYRIFSRLEILIAEKTGPHFALGDTCYSRSEDIRVYNPDGREIISRDNEETRKRRTDPDFRYYNCHTDITIPYDELDSIVSIDREGNRYPVIEGGRYAVPGTEELNRPL